MSVRLVEPDIKLRNSYHTFVQEFRAVGEELIPFFPLTFPYDNFEEFLERLSACARGAALPPGFVPHSTYWLIHNQTEIVGVSNLRHRLTEALRIEGGNIGYGVRPSARRQGFGSELLAQTVDRAGAIGLQEVLLTCSKTNEASVRTILRNGGIFQSEEFLPSRSEIIQRYIIRLTRPMRPN